MSKKVINAKVRKRAITWAMRFVKFNLVGTIVFLIGSAVFTSVFPYFGVWAWFVANSTGRVYCNFY